MSLERLQEGVYNSDYDYRFGSPHLSHHQLFDALVKFIRSHLADMTEKGLPLTVLEIGAGTGGFTEPILASGFAVTATEVAESSVNRLREKFGSNPKFKAVYDTSGNLKSLSSERFAAIVCVSVLHHIPDYEMFLQEAISQHLLPGGTLLTAQDPLWYPTVGAANRLITRTAYYSWRISKGNYRRGLATTVRRIRRIYDNEKPGDVVEYHVVRKGVDQNALMSRLNGQFESVSVRPYWSSQSQHWQRCGHRLGLTNTFAIAAQGHIPAMKPPVTAPT